MTKIRIKSARGPYEVVCSPRVITRIRDLVTQGRKPGEFFLLSSPRVWRHWGAKIAAGMRGDRRRVGAILFDDSETSKRVETVEQIARALIQTGADRDAILVAVGGGVVGDIAGFVAATYLRGVRLVHIPTTLVAQVDSAIGGKTGVNLPEGKNLIGAFYPAEMVLADPDVLSTLPHRQYRSGLYEVIKYGVIADPSLFHFLERQMLALLRRDRKALEYVISRCIRIKAKVVTKDEREAALRQILNFGHTLGHALEAATGYERLLHGEAVGWGMIFASLLALATNRLPTRDAAQIIALILDVGPLPPVPAVSDSKLQALLQSDKKVHAGKIGWVLPSAIGRTKWGLEVPWRLVSRSFRALPAMVGQWQRSGTIAPPLLKR